MKTVFRKSRNERSRHHINFFCAVDAFTAVLGQTDSGQQDVADNENFIFDVVNINIRGGYNSATGTLFIDPAL